MPLKQQRPRLLGLQPLQLRLLLLELKLQQPAALHQLLALLKQLRALGLKSLQLQLLRCLVEGGGAALSHRHLPR